MWECGLKPLSCKSMCRPCKVTPHVGVWIETLFGCQPIYKVSVTPHVGVWIETASPYYVASWS